MTLSEFIDWACIVVIGAAMLVLNGCGGGDKPPSQHTTTTPKGIVVTSQAAVTTDVLLEIDLQYAELLTVAAREYEVYPAHSQIVVQIVPPSPLCSDGISFLIIQRVARGTNYDGTEFDRDGQVNGSVSLCAAGQFFEPNTIKVTEPGIRTSPIVRYELEHWLLYRVDRLRYLRTAYHDTAGHPILF